MAGETIVGQTLTAETTAIMDADGLENVSYSYQWIRVDDDGTSNATPITGETGSTYTLTTDDVGKRIRVRVSFTDDNSIPEERTSEAYPATGTVIDDALVSNLAETTHTSSVAVGNRSGTVVTQGFGTGSHDGNFLLTGVSVHISENNFIGAETATFKIYDSDSDGTPKNELHALTPPDALTAGNLTGFVFFAAPVGAKLEPDTSYHLVFQGTGSSSFDLTLALTSSDDQTGESGWTIEDDYRFSENLSGGGRSVKISVYGVENSPPDGRAYHRGRANRRGDTDDGDDRDHGRGRSAKRQILLPVDSGGRGRLVQ